MSEADNLAVETVKVEAVEPAQLFYPSEGKEPIAPTGTDDVEAEEVEETESGSEVEPDEDADKDEKTEGEDSYFVDLDEQESITVQLKGKEYTKSELEEHRLGYMRQQDYTKKTQEAADLHKTANAKIAEVQATKAAMVALLDEAEALVGEWEPEKLKALQEKKAKLLADSENLAAQNGRKPEEVQAVMTEFWQSRPEWVSEDGGMTDSYKEAANGLLKYIVDNGGSPEELQYYDSRHLQMAYKASQYDKMKAKNDALKKQAKTVPVTPKPSARPVGKPEPKQLHNLFYG